MTFDSLCNQLRELAQQAAQEGFPRVAAQIDVLLVRVRDNRPFYDPQAPKIKVDKPTPKQ